MSFLNELKRRNVFRVGLVYLAAAWLVAQVTAILAQAFTWPHWVLEAVVIVLAIAFPIALVVAWLFELTPEGLRRTAEVDAARSIRPITGRKLDRVLIGVLALIVVAFAADRFILEHPRATIQQPAAPQEASVLADTSARPSLAVLPFENLSDDENQDHFADGLSEELLDQLAQFQDLRVVGRTSSFAFKGKNEDLRAIGKTLGVNHLLEGSVRKSGNELRITAQLINAADGSHVWSQTYDRKLKDIFDIQDDIAMSVANAIGVSLGVGDLSHVPGMTRNVEAYNEYLASNRSFAVTSDDIQSTIAHLERAVHSDDAFALAWLALSNAYGIAEGSFPDLIKGASEKAEHAFDRAQELTPNSPYVLRELARRRMEAERLIQAAVSGGAKNFAGDDIDDFRGSFLYVTGRAREAAGYFQRARLIDPLNTRVALHLMAALAAIDDMPEALGLAHEAEKLNQGPPAVVTGPALVIALASGDRAEIDRWLKQPSVVGSSVGSNPLQLLSSRMIQLLDDPAKGRAEIRRFAAGPTYQYFLAWTIIYGWAAYYGDPDLALDVFRKSAAQDLPLSLSWIWGPLYHDMRKLPGFKQYLRETGIVDYWRKTGNWGDFCHPLGDDDFECS